MTRWGRVTAVVALVVASAGCGRGPTKEKPAAAPQPVVANATHDTLRVFVAGVTIVIPAPEGMVDVMGATGQRQSPSPAGRMIVAVFQPRDSLPSMERSDYTSDLFVSASIPPGNTVETAANKVMFTRIGVSWQEGAARLRTPATQRLAEALHSGREAPIPEPPPDDRLCIEVRSIGSNAWQMLTLGRVLAAKGGGIEAMIETRILVRGRIVDLMWDQGHITSAAQIRAAWERADAWVAAVAEAGR